MTAIRKFEEDLGFGRRTDRVAYVTDPSFLPPPTAGTEWQEDRSFNEEQAIREAPGLRHVFEGVRKHGFAVVNGK